MTIRDEDLNITALEKVRRVSLHSFIFIAKNLTTIKNIKLKKCLCKPKSKTNKILLTHEYTNKNANKMLIKC